MKVLFREIETRRDRLMIATFLFVWNVSVDEWLYVKKGFVYDLFELNSFSLFNTSSRDIFQTKGDKVFHNGRTYCERTYEKRLRIMHQSDVREMWTIVLFSFQRVFVTVL